MPSIEAPTHYERAKGLAPGREDQFFKALTPDDVIAETGSVDQPLGYVTLVKVTGEVIVEMVAIGDVTLQDENIPTPGWYVVRHDDNGLLWAMWYGPDGVFNEENARADFAEAEAVDAEWESTEDNDDDIW